MGVDGGLRGRAQRMSGSGNVGRCVWGRGVPGARRADKQRGSFGQRGAQHDGIRCVGWRRFLCLNVDASCVTQNAKCHGEPGKINSHAGRAQARVYRNVNLELAGPGRKGGRRVSVME